MRKFLMILFLITVIGVLAACSSSEEDSASADGSLTLKFAHGAAEDNPRHLGALKFKELVEEKSEGKIKVEVFGNEVLGTESQMVENLEMNDLDIVASSTFTQYEPKINLFGLPFLFESSEKAWEVLDGELGQEIYGSLIDKNIRIIGHFENGMRHVTSNKELVEKPEDLKGLSIRTPEIQILIDIFNQVGANPTPMAFGELYMALQQGTVDAQENPITNIYASKFYEVQDYLSLTGHSYSSTDIAISDQLWSSLTEEQQSLIQECMDEAVAYQRELVRTQEEEFLKEMESNGMQIKEPSKDEMREATKGVYEKYSNEYGEELVNRLMEAAQ
ncbi:TRAP transporter substrate-binding protein [Lysinibacillus telephonicus]|uniref:TRAP transporter substrate-binding protein n=1 Tax=Lysinibacillus telephonicus TaxID=1714840 RepID=A0A3S0I2P9_9BACI|nr:TRAP transporter substrate-binding protein [Lysinibacillus telephonicus]RTQ94129.1 TRAP transporter substrate-binding protein [Lysinibacillus telephonicus]